jgi:hypothetical protein
MEVVDNGLGMKAEALQSGFAAVGAPKSDVSHIRELLTQSGGRPIGQFGIGVLSCFGVAETIELRSKMDEQPGLAYRMKGFTSDFEEMSDTPNIRGTLIRPLLKTDSSMQASNTVTGVERYARHAAHVEIEDADTGARRPLIEKWNGGERADKIRLVDPAIRGGLVALDPSWDTPGADPPGYETNPFELSEEGSSGCWARRASAVAAGRLVGTLTGIAGRFPQPETAQHRPPSARQRTSEDSLAS